MGLNSRSQSYTFEKSERLYKRKDIQELFSKSSSFFVYPFSVKFVFFESVEKPQILISIPKKRLKRAVDRNLLKRRVREVYRLNKSTVLNSFEEKGISMHVAFVYSANDVLDYKLIENKLSLVIDRLQSEGELFYKGLVK